MAEGVENTGDVLISELKAQVSTDIRPIAKPRRITIVPELPNSRRPDPARSCAAS